jgi:hypothetical protein
MDVSMSPPVLGNAAGLAVRAAAFLAAACVLILFIGSDVFASREVLAFVLVLGVIADITSLAVLAHQLLQNRHRL